MSMARLIVDGIISELLYSSVRWFCVKSIANVSKGFKPILIFFLAACLAAPLPQAWAQTKEGNVQFFAHFDSRIASR